MAASQELYCHKAANVTVQQSTNQLGCWSWGGDIVLKMHKEVREVEGRGVSLLSRPVSQDLAWPISDPSTRMLEEDPPHRIA